MGRGARRTGGLPILTLRIELLNNTRPLPEIWGRPNWLHRDGPQSHPVPKVAPAEILLLWLNLIAAPGMVWIMESYHPLAEP
jgi:hypothetical protein